MSRKILIVDDEIDLIEAYREAFELSGYEVAGTAVNGAEAVKKYASLSSPPDVVVMDHRMPVMNGLEATREILKIDPRAKIIFISADYSIESEALRSGAASFRAKPLTIDSLIENIRMIRPDPN